MTAISNVLKGTLCGAKKLPSLLFMPGMATNARLWRDTFKLLTPYVNCHAIDFSGAINLEGMIDCLHRAVCRYPDSTIVGFSMGGYLSLEYLLKYGCASAKSLVLINCSASGYTEADKKRRQILIDSINIGNEWNTDRRLALFLDEQHPRFKDNLELMRTMSLEVGVEEFIRQQKATIDRKNRLPLLSNITIPTCVIHSANDKLVTSAEINKLLVALPKGDFSKIDAAGHMLPLEQPVVLANCITRWVNKTDNPTQKDSSSNVHSPTN